MTNSLVLPSKRTDARVPAVFNFADQLQFGETITGVSIQVTVFSGVDSDPDDLIYGPSTVSGPAVTQTFTGGVVGVIYQLVAIVTGSSGHVYSKGAKLAIVDSPGDFRGS